MSGLEFDITKWAAWAPGLTTNDAWESWSHAPEPPVGNEIPALTEVPAMTRRRIEKLGRLAFQVAQWVQGDAHGTPLVFASRHGDAARYFDLQLEVARQEPVSPLRFASSVHNAIGSQYSIIRRDPANVVAVANGLFTLEAGLIEAVTLAPEAILIVYDASPHPLLAPVFPETASDFAFAWHVKRGGRFKLRVSDAAPTPAPSLPHALDVFRFILSGEATLRAGDGVSGYEWSCSVQSKCAPVKREAA